MSDCVSMNMHTLSAELEALSDALTVHEMARLSQTSFGWHNTVLVWLAAKVEMQLGSTQNGWSAGSVVGFRGCTNASLRYVMQRCRSLRNLKLVFSGLDLTALSMRCPQHLATLELTWPTSTGEQMPSTMLPAVARGCRQLKRLALDGPFTEADLLSFIESCSALSNVEIRRSRSGPPISAPRIFSALASQCLALEKLDVEGILQHPVGFVGSFPRLQCLIISAGDLYEPATHKLASNDLQYVLERCPRLETLEVGKFRLGPHVLGPSEIRGAAASITAIKASINVSANFPGAIELMMRSCPRLEELDVHVYGDLGSDNARVDRIVVPGAVNRLKTLKAVCCQMTDSAITEVVNSSPWLEKLDVTGNNLVTHVKGSQLVVLHARMCTNLRICEGPFSRLIELDISGCLKVDSIPSCASLTSLNVNGCSVHMAALSSDFPKLRMFSAAGCAVPALNPDANWPHLERLCLLGALNSGSPGTLSMYTSICSHLQRLDLAQCNGITDASIELLARHCARLTFLNLTACFQLTPIAVDVIKYGFPKLCTLGLLVDAALNQAATELIAISPHLLHASEPFSSYGTGGIYGGIYHGTALSSAWHTRLSKCWPNAGIRFFPEVNFSQAINMKVVSQDGNEAFFKMRKSTALGKLMQTYCTRYGREMSSVRFLFDGHRFSRDQYPFEYDMEDGDVIDVMIEQDVGEWEARDSAGQDLLLGTMPTAACIGDKAIQIERAAYGPTPSRRSPHAAFHVAHDLLTRAQCDSLVAHAAELAAANGLPSDGPVLRAAEPADMKVDLTAAELARLVGCDAVHTAITRMGAVQLDASDRQACGATPRLVLRRSAASESDAPTYIRFHRDQCRAIVSIALSEGHAGGHLLFSIDGRVHCPARPVGSAVAHNRTAVHGVSRITSGVRYNLIAVRAAQNLRRPMLHSDESF